MTGVVLAGGNGTRLRPLTSVVNKHLLPVYNRPMIDYPIGTLKAMGCDNIILVSGGEHIGGFAEYLGNSVTYRVQPEAGGIAQALSCVEGMVDGLFPVILGDNFFSETPPITNSPTVYVAKADDPERFGVYHRGKITEKPKRPRSNLAVAGLYVYDQEVFDFIKTLKPSRRGELEITDVNNFYLGKDCLVCEYRGYWRDMGTFDTLLEVSNYAEARNG